MVASTEHRRPGDILSEPEPAPSVSFRRSDRGFVGGVFKTSLGADKAGCPNLRFFNARIPSPLFAESRRTGGGAPKSPPQILMGWAPGASRMPYAHTPLAKVVHSLVTGTTDVNL